MKDCIITMRNADGTQYRTDHGWAYTKYEAQLFTYHDAKRISNRLTKAAKKFRGDPDYNAYQITVRKFVPFKPGEREEWQRQMDEESEAFDKMMCEMYGEDA